MIFFELMCFQDEVKQLSSWKFLIEIGLIIGLAMMFLDWKNSSCLKHEFDQKLLTTFFL